VTANATTTARSTGNTEADRLRQQIEDLQRELDRLRPAR
jgi:hypothetical protein